MKHLVQGFGWEYTAVCNVGELVWLQHNVVQMCKASSSVVSNLACRVDSLCFCEDKYILDDTPSPHFVNTLKTGLLIV